MAMTFTCVCGKKLKALESLQGKHAMCPECGRTITVGELTEGEVADLIGPPTAVVSRAGELLDKPQSQVTPRSPDSWDSAASAAWRTLLSNVTGHAKKSRTTVFIGIALALAAVGMAAAVFFSIRR